MTRGNACTDERYKGTMTLNLYREVKVGFIFIIEYKNNVIPAS